ncbi:hypothetical protein FQN57_002436 [Myotisia sp. PD_48]|nr:hypothetical protein FQN57_002436 [Myotisia sp. PD_48]
MDSEDTFIQHPLHLDPTSKAISAPSSSSPALIAELESLNQLHRTLLNLDTPNNTPAPPRPVNPKRSSQIAKLRDTANNAYRKATYPEAVKLYTYAIDMAFGRPPWEPAGLVREELAALYCNRAQAYMAQQLWPEAWVDAQISVECNEQGNGKAWWRGAKSLVEMSRWDEARSWLNKGLEAEERNPETTKELKGLLLEVEKELERVK